MPSSKSATAITVFHRSDGAGFDDWLEKLLDSARRAAGFVSCQLSLHSAAGLEPAVAVVFAGEDRLHAWLDGPERARVLGAGEARGYWQAAADIVTADGLAPPTGVAGFHHQVAADRYDEFLAAQARLSEVIGRGFPGFLGTAVFPVGEDGDGLSLVRFRTERQLADWLESAERRVALPTLRTSLTRDFTTTTETTPFGTTVRAEHGRIAMTPNWKTAMLVLMVLYPTVMLLSRFLGPVLDRAGAAPWLAMWLSQVVSIALMQWWLMRVVAQPFARWLDPVDGAGWRVSAIGAAAVAGGYALTLAAFANVHWLQYWDFRN